MDSQDLAFAGAAAQARLIADGQVSSRALTELYLERIARLQPVLNAWRVVDAAGALAQADAADARRAAGTGGLLNGVPVAVKDDVDIAGEVTAHGTAAYGAPRGADADVVVALRAAGAVILGKTHVPELTICNFTETLTYGATRNPWSFDHTPGGSSGGTGAAVAAGLCGVGLGSDGAGSIRIPAAWCGLFGLKPQRDRVSMLPHADAWHGLSVNGPIARTVADAALFLDAAAAPGSGLPVPDGGFLAASRREPGRLRVAVSTKLPPGVVARVSADARRAVEETAELLGTLGHEVVRRDPDYPAAAFGNVLVRYLRGIVTDAQAFPHPERFERRTRGFIRMGRAIPTAALARARREEAAIAARINGIFDDVDVLLTPGTAGPPFRIGELQGRSAPWTLQRMAMKVPYFGAFNATGQPAASVPAGFDRAACPCPSSSCPRPRARRSCCAWPPSSRPPGPGPTSGRRSHDGPRAPRRRPGAARAAAPGPAGALRLARRGRAGQVVAHRPRERRRPRGRETIRALLAERRPDDGILGEEGDDEPGTTGMRWIVDPLDGTTNYLYGNPQWCISVACEGRAGVVLDAVRGEEFAAVAGGPATLDGHPLASRAGAGADGGLAHALVGTGFGYDADVRARQADLLQRVLPQVRDVRRAGAAALDLAWVAAGRLDAFYEFGVQAWDIAAGTVICEAVGLEVRVLPAREGVPQGLLVGPPALAGPLAELLGYG
jgi:amidase